MALPNMQDSQAIRTIGKYKILGTLGRGAMGVVYRAQDPEIGRIVAIKVLRKLTVGAGITPEMAHERFKIEARAAGNLRHPHIITLFDVNIEGDSPYIVMDYIDGNGLDVVISRSGKLEPQQALFYLSQVASGLDYAHARNVIHRDIKPSNILVDKTETVFILDFGVASASDTSSLSTEPVMGTPSYMSPEQIQHRELDRRTDLFSLAVVAFECLTGIKPFSGDTFSVVINNILNNRRNSLLDVAPELPLALEAEFERAFSNERENRFSSAEEMILAFASALSLKIPSSPGTGPSGVVNTSARKRKISDWRNISNRKELRTVAMENEITTRRERRDTPEEFSPWRPELRTVRADEFKMTSAAEHVIRPGAMYSGSDEGFANEVEQGDPRYRQLTVIFGILCIILSIVLGYLLFGGSGQSTNSESTTIALENFQGDPLSKPIKSDRLKNYSNVVVPTDKNVIELSDHHLLAMLSKESTSEAQLIDALGEAKRRRLDSLIEIGSALLQNDSYIVRIETLKMFGETGDPQAVPSIVISLDDHDPLVRRWGAKTLAKIGDRKAVGYLQARLMREDLEEVKGDIKKAIEKITGIPYVQ